MNRPTALVALTLLSSFGATACGTPNESSGALPDGTRQVVMVSGRDDHGLVASETVDLRSAPEGGDVVGRLPDGALAQVRDVRGTKVQVSASGVTGWVDDYVLRGEVRLAGPAPGCRVHLAGMDIPAGTRVEVLSLHGATAKVRLLDPPHSVGTIATSEIVELAPLPGQACPPVGSGRTKHDH